MPAAVGWLVLSVLDGARVTIKVSSFSLRRCDGLSGFGLEVRMDYMDTYGTRYLVQYTFATAVPTFSWGQTTDTTMYLELEKEHVCSIVKGL